MSARGCLSLLDPSLAHFWASRREQASAKTQVWPMSCQFLSARPGNDMSPVFVGHLGMPSRVARLCLPHSIAIQSPPEKGSG